MKFLVIRRPAHGALRDVFFEADDVEEALRRGLEEGPRTVDDLRERGKLEAIYGIAGQLGGVAILDVESHDELTEILLSLPLAMLADVEVVPLADWNATVRSMQKLIAQAVTG